MFKLVFVFFLISTSAFADYREVNGPEKEAILKQSAGDVYEYIESCAVRAQSTQLGT